ncbi:hypothetical protein SLG_11880 [Sphingobium sp. SYK-6]|nr:hypothetical protein SLG_11880 [Sphingobium sp. SYK-6]
MRSTGAEGGATKCCLDAALKSPPEKEAGHESDFPNKKTLTYFRTAAEIITK